MHCYNPIDPRKSTIHSQNGSRVNLPRRNYKIAPQDEGKIEWRSLVRHYEDVEQKSQMMERYAKQAFQQRMREDLQRQINEKSSINNMSEKRNRDFESNIINRDQMNAEKDLTNKIAERKTVKNYLNTEYSKNIAERRAMRDAKVSTQFTN